MSAKPAFNLILLGDPAAGKATQSKRLLREYGLHNFDMGEILRRPANKKRFRYAENAAKGRLSPTQFVRRILRDTIPKVPAGTGILFNGHPKMLGEAKIAHGLLKKSGRDGRTIFIYLTIPEKEMLRRIVSRTRESGMFRPDDSTASLRNRMRYYRTHIAEVVGFFRARYPYRKISSLGTKAATYRRIASFIEKELRKHEKGTD